MVLVMYLENMTVVASGPELEPAPNLSPTFLPELSLSKSLERNSLGEPIPGVNFVYQKVRLFSAYTFLVTQINFKPSSLFVFDVAT